ncbi:MAG TPA: response regulator [Flavobacteriales bacterium]|nr:response regulator [Flavobacteriales bacterium]
MNAVRPIQSADAQPCVLFVDDDAGNRQAFRSAFRHAMTVLVARDLQEAWALLSTNRVHVVIADQRIPGTRGSELLALVRERYPLVRRMLATGYADLDAVIEAVNKGGVTKYFAKPWVNDQLVTAVNQAFAEIRAEEEKAAYTERLIESNRQLEFALRQRLLS